MSTKNDKDLVTHEEDEGQQGGLSRRGFLTGAGALAGGTLVGGLLAGSGCAPKAGAAIKKAKGHVNHVSEICTGCSTCSLVCVLTHEQLINHRLARNIVSTDVYDAHHTQVFYCQQCDDPKCLNACPTGALHVDEATGARVIDQKVCIGCQTCLNACIFASTGVSRIKYNAETKKCFKCDLCGGDPLCVKRCPLGASQLSWETYKIVRPAIDDYKEKTVEGALTGVAFKKDYTGPQAGKAQDEHEWACVPVDKGVQAVGSITSSEGGELRVKMKADFYDKDGNLLGSSVEHQWCLTMHESLKIELPFETSDTSKIASVTLVANISYWVKDVDKEY